MRVQMKSMVLCVDEVVMGWRYDEAGERLEARRRLTIWTSRFQGALLLRSRDVIHNVSRNRARMTFLVMNYRTESQSTACRCSSVPLCLP